MKDQVPDIIACPHCIAVTCVNGCDAEHIHEGMTHPCVCECHIHRIAQPKPLDSVYGLIAAVEDAHDATHGTVKFRKCSLSPCYQANQVVPTEFSALRQYENLLYLAKRVIDPNAGAPTQAQAIQDLERFLRETVELTTVWTKNETMTFINGKVQK